MCVLHLTECSQTVNGNFKVWEIKLWLISENSSITDRQTDILFDVYVYIVIQNGLQYNAHDSGYSNKQDKK